MSRMDIKMMILVLRDSSTEIKLRRNIHNRILVQFLFRPYWTVVELQKYVSNQLNFILTD